MSKLKNYLTERGLFLPIALIAAFSILLSVIIIAALMMRPVADDFAYFSDPSIHNPFSFAAHYYFGWTGRIMQALWMSSLYKVFPDHAVTYGTILQLILLTASAIFCAYSLLRRTNIHRIWTVMIGFGIATLFAYMSPSLFDTNLWITSSSVYIGSAIGLLLSIGLTAYVTTLQNAKWWQYTGIGIVIFLSQLFSEPTSIIMIYMGVIGVISAYKLSRHIRTVTWIWLGASALGLLLMYLSPGTHARQGQLQTHQSIYHIASGAFHSFDKLLYFFISYRIWLVIIIGIAITPIIIRLSIRQRIYSLIIACVSAFLIPLSLFVTTQYTLGDYLPLRALTVPSAFLAFCLAVIIAITLGELLRYVKHLPQYALPTIACLLIIPVTFATISASLPTLQAVTMRMNLYDTREAMINQQLGAKQQTITVQPLPVLLDSTEALDINYGNNTPSWLTDAFRTYYHIPSEATIVQSSQPQAYCVINGNPTWFGTKPCAELEK